MFESRLLTYDDKVEWQTLIERAAYKDPHYLPDYMDIYDQIEPGETQRHFAGKPYLFVFGDQSNFIFYPFLKRPIEINGSTLTLYDIMSPYGYGGPLASIEASNIEQDLWRGFLESFHRYCVENGIVSEFARLNPFYKNDVQLKVFSDGVVKAIGKIVYVNLKLTEAGILQNMSQSRRRCVKNSHRFPKLIFNEDSGPQMAQPFYEIYTETMERNQAADKYFFPLSFVHRIFNDLPCCWRYYYIAYESEPCSVALILAYGKIAYLFLQGSRTKCLATHANEYLIHQTILNLKKDGFETFILGGGLSSSNDSLFEYKLRYSDLTLDFSVYNKVHMTGEYEHLVSLYRDSGQNVVPDYFPGYRQP
jgi:serine/alanine adding enzyme